MRGVLLLLLLLSGCAYRPLSHEWRQEYRHLKRAPKMERFVPEENQLIISVDAPHLDLSSAKRFLKTLVKHPATGSMEGHFGHAWITLIHQGKWISCGHSGEGDESLPTYFDDLMDLAESGDPNPAQALFKERMDGFLEEGSGGHTATFSIAISLTEKEAEAIEKFIYTYPKERYSLCCHQCVLFVQKIAALANITLPAEATIPLPKRISLSGTEIPLWEDPCFQEFTFLSPDLLERSMMELASKREVKAVKIPYENKRKLSISFINLIRVVSI